MPTACDNCPLRKCDYFLPMSDDELSFMQRFKSGELSVDQGTTVLMEGSNSPHVFTVLKGMGTHTTHNTKEGRCYNKD